MDATHKIYFKSPDGLNQATSGFLSAPLLEVACTFSQFIAPQEDRPASNGCGQPRKVETL